MIVRKDITYTEDTALVELSISNNVSIQAFIDNKFKTITIRIYRGNVTKNITIQIPNINNEIETKKYLNEVFKTLTQSFNDKQEDKYNGW